jgi:hypothetical protein
MLLLRGVLKKKKIVLLAPTGTPFYYSLTTSACMGMAMSMSMDVSMSMEDTAPLATCTAHTSRSRSGTSSSVVVVVVAVVAWFTVLYFYNRILCLR